MRYSRQQIAARIADDIEDGSYVNLGIGIPTLVANHLSADKEVVFHSENGILGFGAQTEGGDANPDVINASKDPVATIPGSCFMSHADSFALIRGRHLSLAILGAYQVSARGDLANWVTNSDAVPGVGGAMDLAAGARAVWVAMRHVTENGDPKLVERCTYPITATGVVTRVYTDLAVFDVDQESGAFVVVDRTDGLSVSDLQDVTDAPVVAR